MTDTTKPHIQEAQRLPSRIKTTTNQTKIISISCLNCWKLRQREKSFFAREKKNLIHFL